MQRGSTWICATSHQGDSPTSLFHRRTPWRGGWGSVWDAAGGSSLCLPSHHRAAAALCKPASRCGWSFCRCETDVKQCFFLFAFKNHLLALPAVGQRGGDQVRCDTDLHWPLCCPLPAPQSPVRNVWSEKVISSEKWDWNDSSATSHCRGESSFCLVPLI